MFYKRPVLLRNRIKYSWHKYGHENNNKNIIQLLTIEELYMTRYPSENTNIDWGDSRGQYLYSMVDINVICNNLIVNNCFIV